MVAEYLRLDNEICATVTALPKIIVAGSKAGCYTSCTNLTDYGLIPLSYGGTNAVVPQ